MKCCRNMLSLTIPSVPQPAILITVTDILHITAVWPLAPPTWWTWGRWRLASESGRFKSAKGSTTHGRFGSKKEFGTSRLTSFSVMQEYSFLVVLVTILFMNTMKWSRVKGWNKTNTNKCWLFCSFFYFFNRFPNKIHSGAFHRASHTHNRRGSYGNKGVWVTLVINL